MSDEQRRELYAYPGEGDSPSGGKEGGRDQADIARLLRALNDDLRDDEPAQARSGPRAEPVASATPPRYQNTGRMIGGKPSTIAVGVAVVAAAAIGLGSIMFSGGSAPNGSAEPPNLIVPSGGGGASTSAAAPGARDGGTSPFVSSASPPPAPSPPVTSPPVISPPVISPSAAPAPAGMLTPGQTATIVRPPPDSSASESATVVVQPLSPDAGPSSPPPPSSLPSSPPPSQTTPKPSPVKPAVATPTPTQPKPAPAAPAAKTAAPVGGAGNWAVQVGTFSVSANADQLARRLSQNGRQAYVVDWQDRQGRTWKAVRVGNFANEAAARAAAAQLKSEMSLSGQVIDLR